MDPISEVAFPQLSDAELAVLKPLAMRQEYAKETTLFRAGDPEVDMFIVESGGIDILNPANGHQLIVTHDPGQFSGDIDLLTGRPVIVTGVARANSRIWRVPHNQVRSVLNRAPSLGEKMMVAFTRRRELLSRANVAGLRVVGPGYCRDTNLVREFLYKNFVPFHWYDPATEEGKKAFEELGSPRKTPAIECTDGKVLLNPKLQELAQAAGIWRHCPTQEIDFAIVGAGPAGLAAAVYASSEGLSTLVLDQVGPGGQAGGSSRIENFIGFPAGLRGADLAERGVLQMLKFGARIVAPVEVKKLVPAAGPQDRHVLELDCGAKIRCKVLLLALGVRWRQLDVEGANRFVGQGIYYACTSVEADLYDGSDVAVVGAGNSAGQAAMFLAECCRTRNVHLLVRRALGSSMSDYLVNRLRQAANVVIHEQTEIASLHGSRRLEKLTLNTPAGPQPLPCSAVFVFIGAEPSAPWLPDDFKRDDKGYLLTGTDIVRTKLWPRTDRDPCALETTVPGVLAAGDIRSGSTKRVGFAVGDGSLAVTCAHRLLSIQP
jgi:thioredoxin reductase (NADPH)